MIRFSCCRLPTFKGTLFPIEPRGWLHWHSVAPTFGTYRTINRVRSALGARADVYLLASLASNEEQAA